MVKCLRVSKLSAKPKILNVRNYNQFNLASFQEDIKRIPFDQMQKFARGPNKMWESGRNFP